MATHGENCNDWLKTVMTGGCLLVEMGLQVVMMMMMMLMHIRAKPDSLSVFFARLLSAEVTGMVRAIHSKQLKVNGITGLVERER